MNEDVKKKLNQIREYAKKINEQSDYINELIDSVEESEDLPSIELILENIECRARQARSICRQTYDEFEEEQ